MENSSADMVQVRGAKASDKTQKALRSRVANGASLSDGRSVWNRIRKDTFAALVVQAGGLEMLSETRRLVAQRISALEAEIAYLENSFAETRLAGNEPEPWRIDLFGRLSDRQRRLCEAYGWDFVPKPVPTLSEYLQHLADEEASTSAATVRGELIEPEGDPA